MTPAELADLDPFGIFDIEAERLDAFFSSLDQDGWERPSRCKGWSVRDVLAHLAGEEMYNHACLDGDVAGLYARLEREGIGGYEDFNEWCVRQRRALPVVEVLAEWRTGNGRTRGEMRARGRDATLETSIGPYPVGLQAFHYASEYATHADDVAAPVAPGEEPGRTAWRARVGRFVLAEQRRPVEVTETLRRFQVRIRDVTAELSAPDFVTATVARLPDDHPLAPALRDALACLA